MAKRAHDRFATHGNSTGYRGVEHWQKRGVFRARIHPERGKPGIWLGQFGTAAEAARAYDAAARLFYGAEACLNFPGPGEKGTQHHRRAEGLCHRGHDLGIHGYRRPDNGRVHCRECNRLAVHRYTEKRKLAQSQITAEEIR